MDKKKLIGWFIISLMAFSILGFVGSSFFSKDSNIKRYNNQVFYLDSSGWRTKVGADIYYFTNLPEELKNITLTYPTYQLGTGGKIYLAYQPGENLDSTAAMSKVGTFFYKKKLLLVKACTTETGCPDIPIIDCEKQASLVFKKDNQTKIEVDNKCLVLKAQNEVELNKLNERLLYNLLGIM